MSNPLAFLGRLATYALLIVAAIISVFPFLWMALGATNLSADIIKGKATPGGALFQNIAVFFSSVDMPRILFNSFFIAGLGTAHGDGAFELVSVVAVQRRAEFQHHVVGDVHGQRDGAHAGQLQA